MKKLQFIFLILWSVFQTSCNKDFLDVPPLGTISDAQLNTPENIEKLIIAAYSSLGNDHYTAPNSLWPYGDLRSGDAYKGGAGPTDLGDFHFFETFVFYSPDNGLADIKWFRQYVAISRVNNALRRINEMDEEEFPLKKVRQAELKFLRGHFFFDLKILFKHIPHFDETATVDDINKAGNDLSNNELWDRIASDFRFAAENLPESQTQIGRINKFQAKAYLAKVSLYQAYEQDENHNVTGINQDKLNEVVTLIDEVIASGKYKLADDFAEPFLWEFENGPESVFAIQRSIDDNTPQGGRVDFSAMLNNPMNPEFGCCWFHIPSQNLVNAFQTNSEGLPLFDTFNNNDVENVQDLKSGNIDPRLNHTVAFPGVPWKYDHNHIYQTNWARTVNIYGYYSSLKENVSPDCDCFVKLPPFMSSSKNTILIRFSDVLLWKAEALIELGRHGEALPIINRIRSRAASSIQRLTLPDETLIGNYNISTYGSTGWTQDFSRQALRWERRLELAMEGHRFFDLVRWGIASEYINNYFEEEKSKREYLREAYFEKNRDEYLPIPQQQLNWSKNLYEQNAGW
ncbi:RagB/SusD family nutrient uptake outer membrane protein [Mariniphaga sediminis]|uniref:RagB/SusD family nutrient uptake outer membrane protein n=1 Tax=Mariniphaga sediminis TaxID=1628158 RepID=UPI003565034D